MPKIVGIFLDKVYIYCNQGLKIDRQSNAFA